MSPLNVVDEMTQHCYISYCLKLLRLNYYKLVFAHWRDFDGVYVC